MNTFNTYTINKPTAFKRRSRSRSRSRSPLQKIPTRPNISFFQAAAAGQKMAVNWWLTYGKQDINAIDRNTTALYMAAENGHLGIVKLLLRHGADPNLYGYGVSPLIGAMFNEDSQTQYVLVKLLLDAGANVDTRDEDLLVWTDAAISMALQPNFYGFKKELSDVAKLLLMHGADISMIPNNILNSMRRQLKGESKKLLTNAMAAAHHRFSSSSKSPTSSKSPPRHRYASDDPDNY